MAESSKIGIGNNDNCENKTVKKSLTKNSNAAISYLTPNAKQVLT